MVPPTRQLLLLDEQKRLFKSLPLLHLLDPNVVVVVVVFKTAAPLESQLPFFFLCRRRSSKGCFSRHFFLGSRRLAGVDLHAFGGGNERRQVQSVGAALGSSLSIVCGLFGTLLVVLVA
jgi:hypothetical protein